MRTTLNVSGWSLILASGVFFAVWGRADASDLQSGELQVKSVQGSVVYSTDHSTWTELKPGMTLGQGARLKTGTDASADLDIEYSGTALRLRSNSQLELTRMDEVVADGNVVIDTRLNLTAGSLVGSQDKLEKPSTFTIRTPNDSATIRGTQYVVSADGAVTCMRGEVAVTAASHQGSPISAQVPAGFSFNPVTSQVAAIAPANLPGINRDIQTVQFNVDKLGNGDRYSHPGENPDCEVSPHKGHHHHDHDHDHGHDDHNDHDHGDDHGHDHGGDYGGGYGDNHH
ncbi:MAG TPA: FecR domain-containing protein [Candidatus Acidoferrales bacterium]|nr:FecR domain-containing protein [Candidatus Acidoferrales bacterium]